MKICIGNLYSEGCEANLTEFLEVPYTIYPRISKDNKYDPPLQPVCKPGNYVEVKHGLHLLVETYLKS